jgi:hypothetical protein
MHIARIAPQALLTLGLGGVTAAIAASWTPIALAALGPLALLLLGVGTDWLPRSDLGWPMLIGITALVTAAIGGLIFLPLMRAGRSWIAASYVGAVLWAVAGFSVWLIGVHAA